MEAFGLTPARNLAAVGVVAAEKVPGLQLVLVVAKEVSDLRQVKVDLRLVVEEAMALKEAGHWCLQLLAPL